VTHTKFAEKIKEFSEESKSNSEATSLSHYFSDPSECEVVFVLLKTIAYWIRTSDTLVASPVEGDPELLNDVGKFLLDAVSTDYNQSENLSMALEEYYRLIWVLMINGFEIFYRSTESQFRFIKLLLTHSFKFQRQSSSGKRDSLSQYNYYLD